MRAHGRMVRLREEATSATAEAARLRAALGEQADEVARLKETAARGWAERDELRLQLSGALSRALAIRSVGYIFYKGSS